MTTEQKNYLKQAREATYNRLYDISKDFTDEKALSDSDCIFDAITEFADSAVSIYYSDQHNYFMEHSEDCENALLEFYDGDSLADFIKKEGLYYLCCKAGAVGAFVENESKIQEDLKEIIICLIYDYLLNCDIYLDDKTIEEIADSDFDRWDDYADQINETIKED